MFLEYCCYNKILNDYNKETSEIFKAIEGGVNGLALPINLFNELKELIPSEIMVSCPLDYPCGLSSVKAREFEYLNLLKMGVGAIDYVPQNYLYHNKFKELEKEIKKFIRMSKDYGATFRLMMEHNTSKSLIAMGQLYRNMGVQVVLPSIGYHHDDPIDNLIACKNLTKQAGLNCIFNGYFWTEEQADLIKNSKLLGIRLYNLVYLNIKEQEFK